jgi:endogenous inhibitor of DNA gyrase (YacG/DUF329 family)
MFSDRDSLTARIKADLLRPDRQHTTPKCVTCGREFTPKRTTGDDNTERFCSSRCRQAHDNGFPRCEELPSAVDMIGVDFSNDRQVAGAPIPSCTACDRLCVEMYKAPGGPFCSWRCRGGKPSDCIVCGKNLYNIDRGGPYCSTGCANNTKARKMGTSSRARVSGAKSENSVQKTRME